MKKNKDYYVVKNPPQTTYVSTGGLEISVPASLEAEYTIFNPDGYRVINFPNYSGESKEMANLVCKLLNSKRKYKLKSELSNIKPQYIQE